MSINIKRKEILKLKASEFLKSLGCNKISFNHTIQYSNIQLRIDVVGILPNKNLVAVLCGANSRIKLRMFQDLISTNKVISELYIYPYGKDEPFLLTDSRNICPACGNKLGDDFNLSTEINKPHNLAGLLHKSVLARYVILDFIGIHTRKEILEKCKDSNISSTISSIVLWKLQLNNSIEKLDYGIYKIER